MPTSQILLVHAALDETPKGEIIFRGVLDAKTLHLLQVDDYQREVLPMASINRLVRAFELGTVPDIELGMRGEEYEESQGVIILRSPVYIIDGLQRVSAAKLMVDRGDAVLPHLGAVIHFNSNVAWERERFSILNKDRNKLSPNVLLRNWKYDYPVLEVLYALSVNNRTFVLHGRVCWQQRMRREELISATMLTKVAGRLHAHIGPSSGVKVLELTRGLQKVMTTTGKTVFKDNVQTFFNVVDEAWGVKRVAFKAGAHYMRGTFLEALARLFSQHEDFWRDNRLFVDAPTRRKLATFPYQDPSVAQLSSSSGKAKDMLYMLLVDHVNSGRRTRRLKSRFNDYPEMEEIAHGEEGDDEEENDEE